jgi:Tol biopolymer transport system component
MQHSARKYIYLTILIFGFAWASAQKNTARGDRYFDLNMFDAAIEHYQKDMRSRNGDVKAHATLRLADCYRITGDFAKAEETYKKILSRRKKDPAAYLNYGLSLKSSAKYAEAIEQFTEYINLQPDDPMGKIYLMSCDSAQKWLDETIGREVKNMKEINTPASEISPYIVQRRELVFSSSREGSTKKFISLNGGGDVSRLDLYHIELDKIETKERKNDNIRKMKPLNTYMHEGPACFSADGRELFFTRTIRGKRNTETNEIVATLQVFYSTLDSAGKWSQPVSAFAFNSLDYSVGHPALSYDGLTIYFMSDKPGGFGNTDIYYSRRQADGSWGTPVNAGKAVNTFGHELFPALAPDGTLYFSSDGHPGMGQLDIFMASGQNNKWTQVRNLKPPVNSIANDFGISFYNGRNRGFFCSDRFNGKGAEDIYSFTEDVSMEIAIVNDSLVVNDHSLFDDLKYQLVNESDSRNETFVKINGQLKAPLLKNKIYILEAQRYGLVHNHVFLRYTRDSLEKTITYKFATSHKPLRISGRSFVGLHKKNSGIKFDSKKTCSVLGNITYGELEMGIDKRGFYSFFAEMDPGKESIICSKDVIRFEEE